ncbi:MAG: hypothetical protein LRY55_12170 [Leadbetterella sp.]|nr:hypothetical protein [Leadbetterella sp.]
MAKYKIRKESAAKASEPAVMYSSPVFRNYAIKDEYRLIKKAREGLKTEVFYSLADAIKMPEKTLLPSSTSHPEPLVITGSRRNSWTLITVNTCLSSLTCMTWGKRFSALLKNCRYG